MLVGLDLPSGGGRSEVGVRSPRGNNCLAESETADLWKPKWNENQTVFSTVIQIPERDAGPIGVAGSRWFIEIVEKPLAVVCCLLIRDE